MDGVLNWVKVIHVLCAPFNDEHSEAAATVKSPAATVAWYTAAAKGQWLDTLGEACKIPSDL
eukprot:8869737-Lingulodinium_polyedra.AAC.1